MKTMTSKLLIALTTLMLIIFTTSSFKTKDSIGNKYLTMTVIQSFPAAGGLDPKILIVYEDGKSEEIVLEKTKEGTLLSNTIKINKTLNDIANKGYELLSFSDSNVHGNNWCSTYIFIKK